MDLQPTTECDAQEGQAEALEDPNLVAHSRSFIERHRRERDLVGFIVRADCIIYAHVLPRDCHARPQAIPCPVCAGTGTVHVASARPKGPPRQIDMECPLCFSVGIAEFSYSDFASCFQDADLHDARSFANAVGGRILFKPRQNDRLYTLAEAHSYLMRPTCSTF